MLYVIVLVVAMAAGGSVAASTLRTGRIAAASPETWTKPYREDDAPEGTDAPTSSRRRPLPSAPTTHTRVVGAAGLMGVVAAGAGTIALLAYLVWAALKGVFS
ncbi:MAG: hypothetical protein M3O29_03780 [Actinomycetota bacterium]|nr:hypothetical protein [Actinomycetota bacterium]